MAVPCVVQRNSGGRVIVLRAGLSLTGGEELEGGDGISQAGAITSKIQKCATVHVKRSGIPEETCSWGSPLPFRLFLLLFACHGRVDTEHANVDVYWSMHIQIPLENYDSSVEHDFDSKKRTDTRP